jgi:hypothetical protein
MLSPGSRVTVLLPIRLYLDSWLDCTCIAGFRAEFAGLFVALPTDSIALHVVGIIH